MVNSYIIHLERSTQRKPLVEDLKRALPNAIVLSAIDGKEISELELSKVIRQTIFEPKYPFTLGKSEIGCFLSHRAAWQKIANGQADFGIVVEDDIQTGPDFDAILQEALALANKDSLIRFPIKNRERPAQDVVVNNIAHIFRPKEIGLTAALYVLGKTAAKRLVDRSELIDRPVDTWLQMRWVTGVDSLTVWPTHISSAASLHGGSTIQVKQRNLWHKLKRSISRSRYRAYITRKSKIS